MTSVECGNGKENMLKTGKKENQKRAGYVKYVAVILWLIMISLGLSGCRPKNREPQWMEEQTSPQDETVGQFPETDPISQEEMVQTAAEPGEISQSAPTQESRAAENATEPMELYVHVCGAVEVPGVYVLPEGSRVVDAVKAAGGTLESASGEALNQALPVTDGMQIYVPTMEEAEKSQEWIHTGDASEQPGSAAVSESNGLAGKININTADVTTLCTLPGIGESRASSIVAYREEHGGFSTIEDIMKVSGIKDAAFGKIKDKICVK